MNKITALVPFYSVLYAELNPAHRNLLDMLAIHPDIAEVVTTSPEGARPECTMQGPANHFNYAPGADATPGHLPPGTVPSVKQLLAENRPIFGSLVVINPNNVRLTASTITQALHEFQRTQPEAAISCTQLRDHPCQLNQYTSIVDAGHLPFAASAQSVSVSSAPLVRIQRLTGTNVEISFTSPSESTRIVVLVPTINSLPDWGSEYRRTVAPAADQRFIWSVAPHHDGCAYTLSHTVEGGGCDQIVPFVSQNLPWTLSPENNSIRVSSETGNPIKGRQDFPFLLHADGSLAIVRDLKTLLQPPSTVTIRPFLLQEDQSFIIEDHFDYYRYISNLDTP